MPTVVRVLLGVEFRLAGRRLTIKGKTSLKLQHNRRGGSGYVPIPDNARIHMTTHGQASGHMP
jgi:hypothetical protein